MQYTSFNGLQYDLTPWLGRNVALLVPVGTAVEPAVMTNILAAFDAGYDYYQSITGRHPTDLAPSTLNGRTTIAIADQTCGAGCAWLGSRGIEILPDWFGSNLQGNFPWVTGFYDAMAESNSTTAIVFYELGRNFWFYGDQLGDWGFTTGYAIVNRHYARESAGVPLDPSDMSGTYHNQYLPEIAATYFSLNGTTALSTLGQNQGVDNPTGFNGAADLAASLLRIFHDHAGPEAYAQFWQSLPNAPIATTASQAFDNFASVAHDISGIDFSFLFKENWTFTIGTQSGEILTAATTSTERHAVLGFSGADILNGSIYSDLLLGDFGEDKLLGLRGADQLLGGVGADRIAGGRGKDTLVGGTEADTFIFTKGTSGIANTRADTITDWEVVDAIDMTVEGTSTNYKEGRTTATSITTAAAYAESNFAKASTAHVFLYNESADTGYLLSDLNNDDKFETGVVLEGLGSATSFSHLDIV